MEKIFDVKILINFVASCIVICATGFLVIASESMIQNMRYLFILTLYVPQAYFVCFLGDQLTIAVRIYLNL